MGRRITYMQNGTYREDKLRNFYRYDPISTDLFVWTNTAQIQKDPGDKNLGFSSGTHGYALSYHDVDPEPRLELWQYDPNQSASGEWYELFMPNDLVGVPQVSSTLSNLTFIYFTSNANNFWLYVPPF